MIRGYFDGSCAPVNPGGHAHAGFVYFIESTKKHYMGSVCVGSGPGMTNNVAEWAGLICLLKSLLGASLNHEAITIMGDSNMVINQASGLWKIKLKNDKPYMPYAVKAIALLPSFSKLSFKWIPREENGMADYQSLCRNGCPAVVKVPFLSEPVMPELQVAHQIA